MACDSTPTNGKDVSNRNNRITHSVMNSDTWITCFCFLNVGDMLSIHKTCKHFNHLTDNTRFPIINKYWKYHCKQLCINISKSENDNNDDFTIGNWKQLYQYLIDFLLTHSNP